MIHRLIAYSLILLGIGGTIYMGVKGIYGDRYETPSMSIESFRRQLADSSRYILIDVRTEAEISAKPAPWENTIHIPLLALEERCMELAEFKDLPLMMLCPTGNRSRQGARLLRLAGFKAYYLTQGMF
ncbi:rhodanese-like domain-containing protein [bacterium]|nr:rhodanese-like domain-containing protein [bacterium]